MPEPTIITLTRYPDIFIQFHRSCCMYVPQVKKIVVTSGRDPLRPVPLPGAGHTLWTVIEGPEPFNFARNANLGIKACSGDVLLVNDDVQFLNSRTLATLSRLARSQNNFGIVSPQVSGVVGNPMQSYEEIPMWFDGAIRYMYSELRLCFVCVHIKREVFDTIGYLDESFTGYGREDDDFCRRAQAAGFRLAVTPDVVVLHGFQGSQWSSSYRRTMTEGEYKEATEAAERRYLEKYSAENLENLMWRKVPFSRPESWELWDGHKRGTVVGSGLTSGGFIAWYGVGLNAVRLAREPSGALLRIPSILDTFYFDTVEDAKRAVEDFRKLEKSVE